MSYDLEEWNRRWRLDAGKVVCRRCQAQQHPKSRHEPFLHLAACPYRINNRLPWDELDSALKSVNASS